MFLIIQPDYRELLIILSDKNFIIGFTLKKILKYLQFDEFSFQVIDSFFFQAEDGIRVQH